MASNNLPASLTASITSDTARDAQGNLVFQVMLSAEGDLPTPPPQPVVRFERVLGTGAAKGKVTFQEVVTQGGAPRSVPNDAPGLIHTQLQSAPVASPTTFVWFGQLVVPPDSNGVPFFLRVFAVLSGPLPGAGSKPMFQTQALGMAASKFNKAAPVAHVLAIGPVPRLSVALNAAPANAGSTTVPDNAQAAAARFNTQAINAIIDHVVDRLFDHPKFYNSIWGHQTQQPIPDIQSNTTNPQDAEELWARVVSEMLVYQPYGIPTNAYGVNRLDFDYCPGGIQQGATANPLYGLSFACETLATFGVASRGLQKFTTGLEAGSVAAAIATGVGASWFVGEKNPKLAANAKSGVPTALAPVNHGSPNSNGTFNPNLVDLSDYLAQITPNATAGQPLFGPGSVLLFSNRPARPNDPQKYTQLATAQALNDPDNFACTVDSVEVCVKVKDGQPKFTGPFRVLQNQSENGSPLLADHTAGAHIGFVLRTSPDRSQFQVLDTGGLNSSPIRSNDQTVVPAFSDFHSGTFDDPLSTSVKSIAAEPFRGAGVLPKPSVAQYQTMLSHIQNVLLKARPLGLARLILVQRGANLNAQSVQNLKSGFLIYASPAVPMYGPNGTDNFAISRYLWSLRDLPARRNVQAFWLLYTPRYALADAMIKDTSRSLSLAQLANSAFKSSPHTPPNWGTAQSVNIAKLVADLTLPILHSTDDAAGNVKVLSNNYNKPQSMSALHFLEGRVLNGNLNSKSKSTLPPTIKLPMDSQFLFTQGARVQDSRNYLVPAGTPTIGPT